jgi:hypothetical protein
MFYFCAMFWLYGQVGSQTVVFLWFFSSCVMGFDEGCYCYLAGVSKKKKLPSSKSNSFSFKVGFSSQKVS